MAVIFGRIPRSELRAHFTHVGWYFFVPVYLGLGDYQLGQAPDDSEQDGAMVAVRNGVPEWLLDVADAFFRLAVVVRQSFDPDYEPMFPFRVTGPLK